MKAYYFSNYAQQLGSLLIASVVVFQFSKRSTSIRLLGLYGLNSFVFQMITHVVAGFQSKIAYNNLVGNIYTITETLILLYFFYILFTYSWAKRITLIFMVLYFILFFLYMPGHWLELSASIRTLRDLMMIVCSVIYFYFMITGMPTNEITRYPMFWIMAAFLFYFAGTFVLSLSLDFLVNVLKDDLALLWTARNFFRFFFCLLVSYGLWMDLRLVKAKQIAS